MSGEAIAVPLGPAGAIRFACKNNRAVWRGIPERQVTYCVTRIASIHNQIRWSDDAYVVHAGIRPDRSIDRQRKEHCIYIRTWRNPKTQEIWNKADPW
jgi:hypothetical protein